MEDLWRHNGEGDLLCATAVGLGQGGGECGCKRAPGLESPGLGA